MKEWFLKNKVLIIGLLSSIALAVSELIKGGESSTKVLIFSALIAAASFLARNLRGSWQTIAGLFGNALATWWTMQETGHISYAQLIIQMIIGFLAAAASPMKSAGYEKSEVITVAKKEGEVIQPSKPTAATTAPK